MEESQNIDVPIKKNIVHCVCIAEFDILKGNTLSHTYPPHLDINAQLNAENGDDTAASNVADLCLPDGSHVFEEDATYLFLPVLPQHMQQLELDEGQEVIYGIVFFRNKKDPTAKRGAVQKSIVLLTSKPIFATAEPVLRSALNRIMDGADDIDAVLQEVFDGFNNTTENTVNLWEQQYPLNIQSEEQFDGVSLIELVKKFGRETMLLWYAMLLESRIAVVGTPAKSVAVTTISCPSLVRPLNGYTNRINPYVSLTNVDRIISKPSFIFGATNRLFESRTEWWDLCADTVNGTIVISKTGNLALVKLASMDVTHINRVSAGIDRGESEDWVREQFRAYTSRYLRECADRGLGTHRLQIGQFGNLLVGGIDPAIISEVVKKPNFLAYHENLLQGSKDSHSEESPFQFQLGDSVEKKLNSLGVPYFLYQLTFTTTLPHYHIKTNTISRRFRDFVWLRDRLQRFFPGVIVPAIPEKSAMNTVVEITGIDNTETLAYRRRALLKFLERVTAHPTLRHSKDLQTFLEMETDAFEMMRSQGDKEETISNVGGFLMGLLKRKAPEAPQFIIDLRNLVEKLEEKLKVMRAELDTLVSRRQEHSLAIVDLARSLYEIAATESDFSSYDFNLGQIVKNFTENSKFDLERVDYETAKVIEPITYILGMCESIKRVIKSLETMRSDKEDLTAKLTSTKQNLEKLRKGKNEDKIRLGEVAVTDAESKLRSCEENLKATEDLFLKEVERFEQERKLDLEEIMRQFISIRIESAALLAKGWQDAKNLVAESLK